MLSMKDLSPSRGDVYGVSERDLFYDKNRIYVPILMHQETRIRPHPHGSVWGRGVLKHALTDLGGQFPSNF